MARTYSKGTAPAFTTHVPCHPHGTDPSWNIKAIGQPAPIRETITKSWINKGNGSGQVGRMLGAHASAAAVIVVVQANVAPGTHVIRVGKFELRPAIDFVVGVSDITLAASLAAAINALPGYTGVSDGVDTVTLGTTTGHGDDHRMEVEEWGAASAFALTATIRTGFMNRGAPAPAPPVLT